MKVNKLPLLLLFTTLTACGPSGSGGKDDDQSGSDQEKADQGESESLEQKKTPTDDPKLTGTAPASQEEAMESLYWDSRKYLEEHVNTDASYFQLGLLAADRAQTIRESTRVTRPKFVQDYFDQLPSQHTLEEFTQVLLGK
jgi:hypothetical protein